MGTDLIGRSDRSRPPVLRVFICILVLALPALSVAAETDDIEGSKPRFIEQPTFGFPGKLSLLGGGPGQAGPQPPEEAGDTKAISTFTDLPAGEITIDAPLGTFPQMNMFSRAFGNADGEVCVLHLEGYSMRAVHSGNRGQTFGADVDVTGPPYGQAVLAYDAAQGGDGKIYVVLRVADPTVSQGVQFVRSDDMCLSWTAPVTLATEPDSHHYGQKVAIDTGTAGFVAVVFSGAGYSAAYARVSSSSGATWGSAQRLDALDGTMTELDVAVDATNDNVYATWIQYRNGADKLFYNRSTDAGASFVGEVDLSALLPSHLYTRNPDMVVTADGSVVIAAWDAEGGDHVVAFQCTTAGSICTHNFDSAQGANLYDNFHLYPRLTTDASIDGDVLLSYVTQAGGLWVTLSGDNGGNWAVEQSLGATVPVGSTSLVVKPPAARAPDGTWAVAWTDSRDDSYADQRTDVYMRTSADGSTWNAEDRADSDVAAAAWSLVEDIAVTGDEEWFVVFGEARDENRRSRNVYGNRSPISSLSFETDKRIDSDADTMSAETLREPAIATDGAGNVYASVSARTTGHESDLFVASSTDGGFTFGTPIRIGDTTAGEDIEGSPHLAATSDGYVYVAYIRDNPTSGLREVRFNRSSDYGETWLLADIVLGSLTYPASYFEEAGYPGTQLRAVAGGDVYVAWSDGANVYLSRSDNYGSSFTTTDVDQDARGYNQMPVLCAQGDQLILAYLSPDVAFTVWSVWGTVSDNAGVNWSTRVQLRPEGVGGEGNSPSIACEGTDSAVVFWSDSRSATRFEIYGNRYNGTSWDGSELVANPGAGHLFSWINGSATYAGPSDVLVTFGSNDNYSVYVARSTDGGDNFTSTTQLDLESPDPGALSHWPRIASDGAGNVWTMWVDWSTGPTSIAARFSSDSGATWGAVKRLNRDTPQGARMNVYHGNTAPVASGGIAYFTFAREEEGPTVGWLNDIVNSDILVTAWDPDDLDRDQSGPVDCDEEDPSVYAGALQVCDGVNNDCDDAGWPAVPADEGDDDTDQVLDCADNCPADANAGQEDYDGDGTGDACDSPALAEVAPQDNAVDVQLATVVSLRFDEPVDPATVSSSSVQLYEGATPVTGTVTVTDDGLTATLDPTAALTPSATHKVEATTAIEDAYGNPLVAFDSYFKTEASATTEIPLPDTSDTTDPPPSATDARVGSAVAAAGDLNPPYAGADTGCDGPGLQDLVVGAPGYVVDSNEEAGAAIVYLGSTVESERQSPDIIFTGEAAHDRAGVSVFGGHDFNGDGYLDILIGAEQIDRTGGSPVATGAGKVYLVYFKPSEYPNIDNPSESDTVSLANVGTTISGVVFTGKATGDQAGFSVAIGRSVNPGEGPDILIGAPGADPPTGTDAGEVYMIVDDPSLTGTISLGRVACSFDASCGGQSQVKGLVFQGEEPGDHLGYAVSFVGDTVAGPEIDFAMSAPWADTFPVYPPGQPEKQDAGKIYIEPGGVTVDRIIVVNDVEDEEGGSQVNGDQEGETAGASFGEASLLIGAPRYDVGVNADAGRVAEATAKLPAGTIDVSSIGSLDGGDPNATDGIIWTGEAAGDQLGVSGYGLFDVTGNGLVDVGLGAPYADPMGVSNAGKVYIVEGNTQTGLLGTKSVALIGDTIAGQQLIGTEIDENAGTSLAGICDFDGDGSNDAAIGSPGRDVGAETDAGVVYIADEIEPDAPGACGSLGCTVTDLDNGAQLVVAAGALASSVELGVTGILVHGSLPSAPPAGKALLAASALAPDGQIFASPFATATLPTVAAWEGQISGGEAFDYYLWSGSAWVDSGVDGTVVTNPEYPARKAVSATVDTLRYYAAFIPDLDGDGTRDSLDGDRDGDGEDNGTDCLPDDGSVWAIPGEVRDLTMTRSGSTAVFAWLPPSLPGCSTPRYDTIRSEDPNDFAEGGAGDATCVESDDGSDTTASDPATSASIFFYLTRAESVCGSGSAGENSDPSERSVRDCP